MSMSGNTTLRAVVLVVLLCGPSGFLVSQNGTAAQPSAPLGLPNAQSPDVAKARMKEATASFQRGDYAVALAGFQEITAADPANIVAHNMAGNCALRLKNYPAAISSFKKALELQPGESHNEAGLIEAYARAGMTTERDAEIGHLIQLKKDGRLPPNFHFIYDVFSKEDKNVEVVEFYPDLSSGYHFRYWFNISDASGKPIERIALESDDIDQTSFAKEHPQEAVAGRRRFSLDSYRQSTHGFFHFYDGEPTYAQVRAEVLSSPSGTTNLSTSTTFPNRVPATSQSTASAPPK